MFTDSVQPAGLAPVGDSMGLLDVRKNDPRPGVGGVLGHQRGRRVRHGRSDAARVARLATVQNPYTVAADPTTGKLFVAGLTGGVVQITDVTS